MPNDEVVMYFRLTVGLHSRAIDTIGSFQWGVLSGEYNIQQVMTW